MWTQRAEAHGERILQEVFKPMVASGQKGYLDYIVSVRFLLFSFWGHHDCGNDFISALQFLNFTQPLMELRTGLIGKIQRRKHSKCCDRKNDLGFSRCDTSAAKLGAAVRSLKTLCDPQGGGEEVCQDKSLLSIQLSRELFKRVPPA